MTRNLVEPVYVGSFHRSANLCIVVPGRKYLTFNFATETRYLNSVDDIMTLLASTEQSYIAPPANHPAHLEQH